MKKLFTAAMTFLLLFAISPAFAGWNPHDREEEEKAMKETISLFLSTDPSLQSYLDKAYAYAVFPTVGKGAFIGGIGYGKGWYYEGGKAMGKVSITQLSAGLQIGGQAYREIVFFRDKELCDKFKDNHFELGTQLSAIIASEGAGKAGTYSHGVAVFIMPKGGIMAEASVGGQQFNFEPFDQPQTAPQP